MELCYPFELRAWRPKPKSLSEFVIAALLSVLAIVALGYLFGPYGTLNGGILMPLVLAWRYDNEVGACLPLMLLFMIILAVMGLLLYLMAVIH